MKNKISSFDWEASYDALHATCPATRHTPLIGITANFGDKGCELAEGYFMSVLRAGGTPVILPPLALEATSSATAPHVLTPQDTTALSPQDTAALTSTLDRLDGIILSGGADLNPLYVGEEPIPALGTINPRRDLFELLLIRLAFDRQLPILGICRGIQMLAAALGGTIHQDLAAGDLTPAPTAECSVRGDSVAVSLSPLLKHSQSLDRAYPSHTVRLAEGTLLRSIMGADTLAVNSFHHQAVRSAGPHLRVSAVAPDGVIEAVESSEHKSILGVQWHPECFCLRGDDSMMPLFRWLVDEAANYRAARRIHSRILTLDSHSDTPMLFDDAAPSSDAPSFFYRRDSRALVDLHKMTEGGLDATIMVAYIPQGPRTPEGHAAATAYADRQLLRVREMIAHGDSVAVPPSVPPLSLARTPASLYQLKAAGTRAIMLGIENGYAIGRDLSLLRHFRDEHGIVYMTLCHNGNNDICGSARPRDGEPLEGVSTFGADVIREMNRLGIMVDLSHASERSFYDALDISQTPIVCSHSSARALCDHPRNLTDDQLRALAAKGGVAQVTFYDGFLRKGGATILDAVAHLNHMVEVAGIEHVGIGTDFDGDGGVPGLASASELINFTRRLLRERYSEADLRLIWGGNFLRVMETAQARIES